MRFLTFMRVSIISLFSVVDHFLIRIGETVQQSRFRAIDLVILILVIIAIALWFFSFWQPDSRAAVSATAAAVPGAIAAIMWSMRQHARDQEVNRSLFYLDNWRGGVETAYRLLNDGNNDRINWRTAARVLESCREIEEVITEPHHKTLLERLKDEYRHNFSRILGYQNPCVTSSFFYGAPPDLPLDDAAILSVDGPYRDWSISEAPIRVICDFAMFPDDYPDRISDFEFTLEQKGRLWMSFPDLCEWLIHHDRYVSDGKKLTPRKNPKRPIENHYPEALIRVARTSNRVRYKIRPKPRSRKFRIQRKQIGAK